MTTDPKPIDPTSLRQYIYDSIIESAVVPTSADIARHFRTTQPRALSSLATLNLGKTVLLDPASGEIWMAGPFSAKRTTFTLSDGEKTWSTNCAWDLFGAAKLIGRNVCGTATCGDCGDPFSLDLRPGESPPASRWLTHVLLPAREWYTDVGYT